MKLVRKVGQIVKLCEKWLACLEVSVYFIAIFVYFTHVITDWKNKFPLNATFIAHLWQGEITHREWIISDELWTTWIILRLKSKREISHSQVNPYFETPWKYPLSILALVILYVGLQVLQWGCLSNYQVWNLLRLHAQEMTGGWVEKHWANVAGREWVKWWRQQVSATVTFNAWWWGTHSKQNYARTHIHTQNIKRRTGRNTQEFYFLF